MHFIFSKCKKADFYISKKLQNTNLKYNGTDLAILFMMNLCYSLNKMLMRLKCCKFLNNKYYSKVAISFFFVSQVFFKQMYMYLSHLIFFKFADLNNVMQITYLIFCCSTLRSFTLRHILKNLQENFFSSLQLFPSSYRNNTFFPLKFT